MEDSFATATAAAAVEAALTTPVDGGDILHSSTAFLRRNLSLAGDNHDDDDDDLTSTPRLSDQNYQALVIIACCTAFLSILGSSAIIYMVIHGRRTRRRIGREEAEPDKKKSPAAPGTSSPDTKQQQQQQQQQQQKQQRSRWTPYTRLLLGMSISDILLSLHYAIGNFLRPSETSHRAWAYGNDASCSASGFIGQLAISAILYNGMLSIYFLLTARFRWSNRKISKTVEPLMHIVAIGFPLLTASVGAIMGFFAEPELGLGCAVNSGPGVTDESVDEQRDLSGIGWVFQGIPRVVIGTLIIINNLVIWRFVKRQARPFLRQTHLHSTSRISSSGASTSSSSMTGVAEEESKKFNKFNRATRKSGIPTATVTPPSRFDDESMLIVTAESENDMDVQQQTDDEEMQTIRRDNADQTNDKDNSHNNPKADMKVTEAFSGKMIQHGSTEAAVAASQQQISKIQKDQLRRLYLVRSQSVLFVASYFLSNIWNGLTIAMESRVETEDEEMEQARRYYFVLVLYSFFVPLQGFFNMFVFMRPKYKRYRHDFPNESRLWAFRTTLCGDGAVPPTLPAQADPDHNDEKKQLQEGTDEPSLQIVEKTLPVSVPVSKEEQRHHEKVDNVPATCADKIVIDNDHCDADKANNTSIPLSKFSSSKQYNYHTPMTAERNFLSSLTLSIMEEEEEEEEQEKREGDTEALDRWNDPHKLTSWVTPTQHLPRRHTSSLLFSSLQTISELTQMTFVEDEEEAEKGREPFVDDRWNTGCSTAIIPDAKVDAPMSLMIPTRVESGVELTSEIEDVDDDGGRLSTTQSSSSVDEPIRPPRRKLSPVPPPSTSQKTPPTKTYSASSTSDGPIVAPGRSISPPPPPAETPYTPKTKNADDDDADGDKTTPCTPASTLTGVYMP